MGRAGWGAAIATLIVVAVSCSSAPSKPAPTGDVVDPAPVTREAAEILLSFSAYDYAVVGGLNGERVRAVTPERYAAVARAQAAVISDAVTRIIAAVVDTTGPVHDRLVELADLLGELRRDALAYADGRNLEALARVMRDVDRGWALLRETSRLQRPDPEIARLIDRGTSIRTSVAPGRQALVTIGPYGGAAEAAEIARGIGPAAVPATESPFVVRIVFPDRASADEKARDLQKHGTTAIVIDQTAYAFSRSGAVPDAELWREPERSIDTHGGARRVALSGNAGLVATGSDDGYIAVFANDGVLKALPRFNAGVNQLLFAHDGSFLFGGGQLLMNWVMPQPTINVGEPMRLAGAPTSAVYIPKAHAFAAASAGVIGARAPDGAILGAPFPIGVGASGAILAASAAGELFIASQAAGGYEVRVLRVGLERFPRGILRVPGTGRAFAVDRSGAWGAAITDQGTFRFSLKAADPTSTIRRLGDPGRDVEFAADATLYLLEQRRIVAVSPDGATRWTKPLVDGRRLAVGARPVVLDGTDRLVAFAPQDGAADALAPVGQIQDLVASYDGRWIGVIAEARRAVLFRLK